MSSVADIQSQPDPEAQQWLSTGGVSRDMTSFVPQNVAEGVMRGRIVQIGCGAEAGPSTRTPSGVFFINRTCECLHWRMCVAERELQTLAEDVVQYVRASGES